jgi:Fur family transcriptional regulator, ferric uptake regulator
MTDYVAALREKGLRATSQRVILLKLIAEVKGHKHLTAGELHEEAGATLPGLNLATVYRTMEGLHEAGLVDRLAAGLDQVHYSYRDPDHRHGHLCCHSCNKVSVLEYAVVRELSQSVKQKYGFELADNHLGLSGLCSDCQKAREGQE